MAPKKSRMGLKNSINTSNGIEGLGHDILGEILSRLPAKPFAFSCCVSRSWNQVCRFILSKPKLVTALSMELSPKRAIKEVVKEVLSKPIRPQFVIACFTMSYNSTVVHHYMKRYFSSKVRIITNLVEGVIGNEIHSNELTEVTANDVASECYEEDDLDIMMPMLGIVLIVGSFPDMQVEAIPLFGSENMNSKKVGVDKFIDDVKHYSLDVSGFKSPAALIIFGDKSSTLKSELLYKLDKEFSIETAIVGHFNGCFEYRSVKYPRRMRSSIGWTDAIALVIARDKNTTPGRTQFHVPCMRSVSQNGSTFCVDSINKIDMDKGIKSHLIAKRLSDGKIIHGGAINRLEGMDERVFIDDLYIGIEKRILGSTINKEMTSSSSSTCLSLRGVEMNWQSDDGPIIVHGEGINAGDTFEFYHADFKRGLAMSGIPPEGIQNDTEVFGSLIFSHLSKTVASYNRCPITYTLPFYDKFGDIPIGGVFSKNLIKRGSVVSAWKDGEYQKVGECITTHKGNTFLVMSYTPPNPQD